MQLDIFEHSCDTMLRNDVLDALLRGEADHAQGAWQKFADECPQDATLVPLTVLIGALRERESVAFPDHDALRSARRVLDDETRPAAVRLFGEADGAKWLLPLLRTTAQRSAALAFRTDRTDDHAAPLWLLAGNWPLAADAVQGIESWRRIPAPLAWMAEARHRIAGLRGSDGGRDSGPEGGREGGQDGSWSLLVELAWLAPARFGGLATRLGDPQLSKLLKKFGVGFEGDGSTDDLAWFPAYIRTL